MFRCVGRAYSHYCVWALGIVTCAPRRHTRYKSLIHLLETTADMTSMSLKNCIRAVRQRVIRLMKSSGRAKKAVLHAAQVHQDSLVSSSTLPLSFYPRTRSMMFMSGTLAWPVLEPLDLLHLWCRDGSTRWSTILLENLTPFMVGNLSGS